MKAQIGTTSAISAHPGCETVQQERPQADRDGQNHQNSHRRAQQAPAPQQPKADDRDENHKKAGDGVERFRPELGRTSFAIKDCGGPFQIDRQGSPFIPNVPTARLMLSVATALPAQLEIRFAAAGHLK